MWEIGHIQVLFYRILKWIMLWKHVCWRIAPSEPPRPFLMPALKEIYFSKKPDLSPETSDINCCVIYVGTFDSWRKYYIFILRKWKNMQACLLYFWPWGSKSSLSGSIIFRPRWKFPYYGHSMEGLPSYYNSVPIFLLRIVRWKTLVTRIWYGMFVDGLVRDRVSWGDERQHDSWRPANSFSHFSTEEIYGCWQTIQQWTELSDETSF